MAKVSERHVRKQAAATAERKKWTFMVYLAGDNNLDANGVHDLGEMKKVGSTGQLNLVAQFDRRGKGMPTRRFYLRRGTSLTADTVMKLRETNTGTPEALVSFARWAAARYPAERYALVLWNHGAGWDDENIYRVARFRPIQRRAHGRFRHTFFRTTHTKLIEKAASGPRAKAILFDDNARDFLDDLELKSALLEIKRLLRHKIDLLGMDACLMSMAEVMYQVRDAVQIAVGSEETEPTEGWPYDTVLRALAARPGMDPEELGRLIVDRYVASYGAEDGVTQSAVDLSRSGALADAVGGLGGALSAALDEPGAAMPFVYCRDRTQSFEVGDNVDLVDLCHQFGGQLGASAAVARACQQVTDVVGCTNGLVRNAKWKGAGMKDSHGLAIYFPKAKVSDLYARLDFAKVTKWGEFLRKYVSVTRAR